MEKSFQGRLTTLAASSLDLPETIPARPVAPPPRSNDRDQGRRKSGRRTRPVDKNRADLAGVAPGSRPGQRSLSRQTPLSDLRPRFPSDADHLRFAQNRALGRKVSDEFTVPLCRGHHREAHRCGDEAGWWKKAGVDPTLAARGLWLNRIPCRTKTKLGQRAAQQGSANYKTKPEPIGPIGMRHR